MWTCFHCRPRISPRRRLQPMASRMQVFRFGSVQNQRLLRCPDLPPFGRHSGETDIHGGVDLDIAPADGLIQRRSDEAVAFYNDGIRDFFLDVLMPCHSLCLGIEHVLIAVVQKPGGDVPDQNIADGGLDIVLDPVLCERIIAVAPVCQAIGLHILVQQLAHGDGSDLLPRRRHQIVVFPRDLDLGAAQSCLYLGVKTFIESLGIAGYAILYLPFVAFFTWIHIILLFTVSSFLLPRQPIRSICSIRLYLFSRIFATETEHFTDSSSVPLSHPMKR